ncbi:CYTH domain-containing protein [Algiphilus sp.]|uniref:CYTH domain-containing protein n=1 Tax=Algiphilus sp. TaxID=1872431 RepID=UPI001CA68674|nr:CYTH domain-containing protein [Algiphilus acroporae]MCI5063875.1 CYTH domain-containing protein [Algiphilus sp.]MCR9090649.1 CYTH domain-containing protein [Pseudomonadota bacterium]
MALEIERKFLVVGEAWRGQAHAQRRIRQGYLSTDGGAASVRVRVDDHEARLNIKAAVVGSARAEYDYPVPRADAEEMLDTLCVGCLDKTRYLVNFAGHCWEVDEFHGANAGLVVAEIELDAVDEVFARPDWAGEEVTEQKRYYNHALALHPWSEWAPA